MKAQLAVIILNYRTPELTIDCLASMENEIDDGIFVIVVDNNSGDGSCEKIEECLNRNNWRKWCRLIPSEVNGGFAAGNNLGIRAVVAEAYVLLNSDTLIRPGAFSSLLDALRQNPDAGIVAPGLENNDGVITINTFRFVTPVYEFMRAAGTRPISSMLRKFNVVLNPDNKPFEPQWVGFACVIIRKEVIDLVGLLDEDFFMYFEDIDYCRRVRERGWRILYWPDARVAHLIGGSSGVTSLSNLRRRPPKYYYEARANYFKKYYGILGFITANILWTAGRFISFLREKIGNKTPTLREKEYRDIWIGFKI
jgi:N-acetylglucosaminyl-diphospho-decaprenol L-rhamnosyltransferase